MTRSDAEKAVWKIIKKWSPRLGLDGWKFRVHIDDAQDVEVDGVPCVAFITVTPETQSARITVGYPWADDYEIENDVLHEMLHPYFDPNEHEEGSYNYVRIEQGTDKVSTLLVEYDRELERLKGEKKPE